MAKIELPLMNWLIQGGGNKYVTNNYSGSLGATPSTGSISERTFNYRVCVDTSSGERDSFLLKVETYIIQPWNLGGNKTDPECASFPCTEDGLRLSAQWLSETSAKYGF